MVTLLYKAIVYLIRRIFNRELFNNDNNGNKNPKNLHIWQWKVTFSDDVLISVNVVFEAP